MLFQIRYFQPTESEYEAIALVEKAVYPENADTVADFKHSDAIRQPDQFFQRWVVEQDGRIVAFGHVGQPPQFSDPGRYRSSIIVHPEAQRRGIGTAVFAEITNALENRRPQPTILEAGCYRHHDQSIRFLQSRGFQQTMCWVISKLDVPTFDSTPFTTLHNKMASQNIEIITLAQLQQRNSAWLENLYDLAIELMQDVPVPYSSKEVTLDHFRQRIIENPNVIPEGWMVALEHETIVGESSLNASINPGILSTGFTGVRRPYRRYGVATALKVRAIGFAQEAGYRAIRTGNEENNPMLQLNKKLGFRELTASLAFEKRLSHKP